MLFMSRERQVLEHIRGELEDRLTRSGAPQEIRSFLFNRWSYLLAGIYFSHGDRHPDWEAGWQTVNALLWSLVPKHDREETEQLLRLLPTLLERLQDGCDAMNLDQAERDALFSQLAMLHAAVAREGLQAQMDAGGPITQLAGDADMEMSNEELADLTHDTVPVEIGDPVASQQEDGPDLARIKLGDGLLLRKGDTEKKLLLQWVSPMGGMYLFADAEGFDAVSLTKARLIERLRSGEVRLVQG